MVTPLESGLPRRKRKIGSQNPEEESLQLRHDTYICSHRKYILRLNLDIMLSILGVQLQFVLHLFKTIYVYNWWIIRQLRWVSFLHCANTTFVFQLPSNENRAVPNVPVVDASILQIDKSILNTHRSSVSASNYRFSNSSTSSQVTVRKLSF